MVANNEQKREKCEADLNKFVKDNYREHINNWDIPTIALPILGLTSAAQ